MRSVLGIDVSKSTLDVCLIVKEEKRKSRFKNSEEGFGQLQTWLAAAKPEKLHVCMESTGCYGDAIAHYLHQRELLVSVVNPRLIKSHAASQLLRSKTDKLDAFAIADYCRKNNPPAWQPKAPEIDELQEINAQINATTKMIVEQKNRLESVRSTTVRQSIEDDILRQNKRLKEMETAANQLIKGTQQLNADKRVLMSIPGIGDKSANLVLSKIDFRRFRSGRQIAAFTGVTPSLCESGTSIRKRERISRVGDSNLRKALYWPAVTAIRCNPMFKAFAQRLRENGKPEKVIICAVMRKLVILMHALVIKGESFDSQHESIPRQLLSA